MQVHFGDFVFDSDTRELRRGDKVLSLTPKAFQLLQLLIENRPRALDKRELRARLWPDTVVEEGNLANLVAEIRAALDDDPREPRFVRTLHRFGYAFRDQVETGESPRRRPVGRLVWKRGQATLGEGEHVLGRDPELDLYFDAESVSRRHAQITVRSDETSIEDLGSKNGTFVEGRRVQGPTRLADGDEIRLGSVRLRFREVGLAASTKTQPKPD